MGIEIQQVIDDTSWLLSQLSYTRKYRYTYIGINPACFGCCVKWVLGVGSLSVFLPVAVGLVAICSLIIYFRRDLGLGHQIVSPVPQYSLIYTDSKSEKNLPVLGLFLESGAVKYKLFLKMYMKSQCCYLFMFTQHYGHTKQKEDKMCTIGLLLFLYRGST